jgi:uncharacterized protein (TIGR04255 family)
LAYPHHPITEAVVEVRVASPVPQSTLEKMARRFKKDYPLRDDLAQVQVQIQPSAPPQATQEPYGFKLSSEDGTNLILLSPISITTSRLAPYLNWEDLIRRAQANWETWKKVVGYRQIVRIGVRFINRIDVPTHNVGMVRAEDYLTISITLPHPDWIFSQYAMQVILPVSGGITLVANTATIPSPIVDHGSFVLDLDFSKEGDLPQRDDELWSLINSMRQIKNDYFEKFITDKSRALFA